MIKFLSTDFQNVWRETFMNHKSIMRLLAALFSITLLTSLFTFSFTKSFIPEFFFALFFALMVLASIFFFQRDARLKASGKGKRLVRVINQQVFIGRSYNLNKRKNLFLRVSIITLLGFFKKK